MATKISILTPFTFGDMVVKGGRMFVSKVTSVATYKNQK